MCGLRQLDPAVTREMEDAVLRTIGRLDGTPFPSTARLASRWLLGRAPAVRHQARDADLETAYCAEVLAATYQAMGLLAGSRHPDWYDAGRSWSGDNLGLSAGFRLGGETAVHVPPSEPGVPQTPAAQGRGRGVPPGRAIDAADPLPATGTRGPRMPLGPKRVTSACSRLGGPGSASAVPVA